MNRAERINAVAEAITNNNGWLALHLVPELMTGYATPAERSDAALRVLAAAEKAGVIARRAKDFGAFRAAGYVLA